MSIHIFFNNPFAHLYQTLIVNLKHVLKLRKQNKDVNQFTDKKREEIIMRKIQNNQTHENYKDA